MFDALVDFIGKNWSGFLRLHYAMRAVILAFLVAMAGTLAVTLFSAAATSRYAIGLGIKPPLQEISAVQDAVFIWALKLSMMVWLGLSVVFAVLTKMSKLKPLRTVVFLGSFAIVLGFYGYILMQLFSANHFETVLLKIKLGGFSEIVLYENKIDKTEHKHECQLVLYANDAVTCYFTATKTYTQFPIVIIQRIDYQIK